MFFFFFFFLVTIPSRCLNSLGTEYHFFLCLDFTVLPILHLDHHADELESISNFFFAKCA